LESTDPSQNFLLSILDEVFMQDCLNGFGVFNDLQHGRYGIPGDPYEVHNTDSYQGKRSTNFRKPQNPYALNHDVPDSKFRTFLSY